MEKSKSIVPYTILFSFQVLMIILFATLTIFDEKSTSESYISTYYGMFIGIEIMLFLGFGLLMTFLANYSWAGLGFAFFFSAFSMEWGLLTVNFFKKVFQGVIQDKISLNLESLIESQFAAAAVLISLCALLGKISLNKMFLVAAIELIFYGVNNALCTQVIKALDVGGSILIHAFGCYFGLTVSLFVTDKKKLAKANTSTNKVSDLLSLVGTIFLWIYWPSFNGALAVNQNKSHVIMNTVLSLVSCCICSFLFSGMIRPEHKFAMVDLQNATIAGGVAIGTSSNMLMQPYEALNIGLVAALISVFGFAILMDYLFKKISLHDSCGINNLHGLPGILGGISSIFAVLNSNPNILKLYDSNNITPTMQSFKQIYLILITIDIAIFGGIFAGLCLKFVDRIDKGESPKYFEDNGEFIVEDNTNKDSIEQKLISE